MADDPQAGQLVFDARTAAALERQYERRDIVHRRGLVLDALAARPGERVVDVGCGPGFYVVELARRVGRGGAVTGVDRSPAMLEAAARRCAGHDVTLLEGEAGRVPVDSGAYDAAVSVQVLEYVPDVPAALAELHRVVRPGGRVVVWDVDWGTTSLASADAARTTRVLDAWDAHLADPVLPRRLGPLLGDAGFTDVAATGHAFVTTTLDLETYGGFAVTLMADYVGTPEAEAWLAELRERDARGGFYFACTQVCFTATRPATRPA